MKTKLAIAAAIVFMAALEPANSATYCSRATNECYSVPSPSEKRAEAENRAYVPDKPHPNSTRLPYGNHLSSDAPTSGNGCGGIGVVAIIEAERLAAQSNMNPNALEHALRERIGKLYQGYWDARYRDNPSSFYSSSLGYDLRDLFVPDLKKLDEGKIRECLPTLARLTDTYREQQQKLREAQQEAARQAALPQNRVLNAYAQYAEVAFCNEARAGYLVQYVNDYEFGRAKTAIKAIVAAALKEDPSLNTDDLWNKGRNAYNLIASEGYCRQALFQLLNASPVTVYEINKP
jgi:hypothetical protein